MALKNEIGNVYGKLTVIARAENTRDGRSRWLCECECGKQITVLGTNLRKGNTKSCGCSASHGNEYIEQLLLQKGIVFTREKIYNDCISPTGALLKFDFCIEMKNKIILIEYNGIQHYSAVDFFGGEEALLRQQERDNIKKKYCLDNNYCLEIIRYDENIKNRLEEILNGV